MDAASDVTRLTAVESTLRGRAEALAADVAGLPSEAALDAAIIEASRLADEQRTAAAAQAAAEESLRRARVAHAGVAADRQRATADLIETRDRLATLGPPPLPPSSAGRATDAGGTLAAGWTALVTWATTTANELHAEAQALDAERDSLAGRRDATEAAARQSCTDLLGVAVGELPAFRDALVRAEQAASAAVDTFDADRARLGALRERVEHLVADSAIATELGNRLRANGFEAWLMRAALEELVDDASVRLRELSTGQFSLELVGDEFMVRDHANADELRSARTLSGGETFLAALALALALADATSELSAATQERGHRPWNRSSSTRASARSTRPRSTSWRRRSRSSGRAAAWLRS